MNLLLRSFPPIVGSGLHFYAGDAGDPGHKVFDGRVLSEVILALQAGGGQPYEGELGAAHQQVTVGLQKGLINKQDTKCLMVCGTFPGLEPGFTEGWTKTHDQAILIPKRS